MMCSMMVKVIIERSEDGVYYCVPLDQDKLKTGVLGCGKTVEEAKQDFYASYAEAVDQYGEVEGLDFDFAYDIASFLQMFSRRLSLAGLEAITGINRKQLNHYVTGHRKPKPATVEKIAIGIKKFQEELSLVSLI